MVPELRINHGDVEGLRTKMEKFYLSTGEGKNLDQQISNRRQAPREPIRAYITAMLTLLKRRGDYEHELQKN